MRAADRYCFILGLVLGLAATPAQAVSVEQIPSPRPAGWAVDLTSTLPAATLSELNRLADDVKARTGAEVAVVVVASTDGAEPHDFATRLFNAWGLGERGKDNGLLVFAALDDHSVEIVLGDGLNRGVGSQVSAAVLQEEMIPRFRAGDPGGAILEGTRACIRRILDVAPSASLPAGPPLVDATGPTSSLPEDVPAPASPPPASSTPSAFRSRFDPRVLLPIGLAGSLVAALLFALRPPRCPQCKQKLQKLSEAEDDAYLKESEQVEERIGSVDHQVWACPSCGQRLRRRFVRFFSGYTGCPECSAVALQSSSTVLVQATYDHGGSARVEQKCVSCGYSNSYTESTPTLVRPTESHRSSSFSSSNSGGSSSSHSSSSGFGGGHSSGGGASGHW